jgi:hypothetical protein
MGLARSPQFSGQRAVILRGQCFQGCVQVGRQTHEAVCLVAVGIFHVLFSDTLHFLQYMYFGGR